MDGSINASTWLLALFNS